MMDDAELMEYATDLVREALPEDLAERVVRDSEPDEHGRIPLVSLAWKLRNAEREGEDPAALLAGIYQDFERRRAEDGDNVIEWLTGTVHGKTADHPAAYLAGQTGY
ncbi:hypothetical protein [Actinokineospora enzanensis]|uniref:hypothetical protein n=1 Tax=Actinokineospora enzanensis TaxID=155975 RepID=UPI00035FB3DB|nr:hypothetical protein [Actinokineospora enzanensis]